MDIKEMVLRKHHDGYNATEIYNFFTEHFGNDAIAYPTITKYIRLESFPDNESPQVKNCFSIPDYRKDQKIQRALDENPLLSVRGISSETNIAPSTVHWILTTRMKYESKLLRKIPHTLTNDMKFNRVQCSRQMLATLRRLKRDKFRYFTTGDESFFMWDTVKKQIWLPIDQKPPKRSTDKYESSKIMICIFWSPNGIQVLKYLPEGESFNSSFFIDEVLKEILKDTYARDAKKKQKTFLRAF